MIGLQGIPYFFPAALMINPNALSIILFCVGMAIEAFLLVISAGSDQDQMLFFALPDTTKYHVLSYTILFWAVLGAFNFNPPISANASLFTSIGGPAVKTALFFICLAFSAGILFSALSEIHFSVVSRSLLYAWHLAILVFLGFAQFMSYPNLKLLWNYAPAVTFFNFLEIFIAGMTFSYILANFFPLLYFFEEDLNSIRGDPDVPTLGMADRFSRKFRDIHSRSGGIMLLLGIQLVLLALNHFLNIIPRFLLIDCCIVAAPPLITLQLKTELPKSEPDNSPV
ncbi:MAG: hypothetical protein NTX59_12880 [Elusimicrobia bacterium]|nr:hypothetical protein [Elusimicrobiota bacterium]